MIDRDILTAELHKRMPEEPEREQDKFAHSLCCKAPIEEQDGQRVCCACGEAMRSQQRLVRSLL